MVVNDASSVVARARAEYLAGNTVAARQLLEAQPHLDLDAAALLALCWVRQVLSDRPHGACVDAPVLQNALALPFAEPRLEGERQFALGWLHWLAGDFTAAEARLDAAVAILLPEQAASEAGYWRARVRLALGHDGAVAEYEALIRRLPADPKTTCYFVDLLWCDGQHARAESVWRAVRGNRKVTACDEAPLLEARSLLYHGETAAAERLLVEATPRGGTRQVERELLLAWVAAAQPRTGEAVERLHQAEAGPFPSAVVASWRRSLELRAGEPGTEEQWPVAGPKFAGWVAGQRARSEGRSGEARIALRACLNVAPLQIFARYALACIGEGDLAAVLTGQPGWFLAVRCRFQQALARFCRREASPAELLDALHQAESAGYRPSGADHYRRLAHVLKQRTPHADDLRRLIDSAAGEAEPARRNLLGAAFEAARLLPSSEAVPLLQLAASREPTLQAAAERELLRRQVRERSAFPTGAESIASLVPDDSLAPLLRLWQAAQGLARGPDDVAAWRQQVKSLCGERRLRGLAQALLTQEAAQRGDVATLAALLDEMEAWQGLAAPPRFVVAALVAVLDTPAAQGRLRGPLGRWLALWDTEALGPAGRALTLHAGVRPGQAGVDEPPRGVPAGAWCRHQAALALTRGQAREALAWLDRAPPDEPATDDGPLRTELRRLARAEGLAGVMRMGPEQELAPPRALAGTVAALEAISEGAELLNRIDQGDFTAAREALAALADHRDLPPNLAHSLAVIAHRTACFLDDHDRLNEAALWWRRAWLQWGRVLPWGRADHPLVRHLIDLQKRRIAGLLARDAVAAARQRWDLLRLLPEDQAERVREELLLEGVAAAREAAQQGNVPAGWRADHEKGIALLARWASLAPDDVRVLTALVEACNDWFLDCYNNEDVRRLVEGVERFTPVALRLARKVADRPGELTARAALAEFTKVRGFIAPERDQKMALFREALAFDPSNENVQQLLAEVEGPREVRT